MRVHDTQTGKFHDRKANDAPYAILSHTWDASEQSFQDVQRIQDSVNVRRLLRMVFPALLWFLSISLSYFLRFLADVVGPHDSHPPTRDSNLPSDSSSDPWSASAAAADTSHGRIFHLRIRIASDLRAWSQSLEETARSILPRLSVLNDLRLSEKIHKACAVARFDQFSQLWVDTSCIDKTSSTELSEAINSMYAWYRDATVCYVFLADVPLSEDHHRPGSAFRHSWWFTRGWTLQELIASQVVVFLSQEWDVIGTKESLADLIEDITGIDRDVLTHRKSLDDVSVAARMSWAAGRRTTRDEDEAYCLLGLLGVVMTPYYGEGRRAFKRLSEKILLRHPNETLPPGLPWRRGDIVGKWGIPELQAKLTAKPLTDISKRDLTLLAPSPRSFLFSRNIRFIHPSDFCHRLSRPDHLLEEANLPHKEYSPSPYGIRSRFHLIPLLDAQVALDIQWYLAILSCERSDLQGPRDHLLARLYYTLPFESTSKMVLRVAFSSNLPSLTCIPLEDFTPENLQNPPESIAVHIPHSTSSPRSIQIPRRDYKIEMTIIVPRWTKATLRSRGYQIECDGSNAVQTSTVVLRLPRIPLIMCLRKGEQETSIFVPVRTEDRYWRLRWVLDLRPDGDDNRNRTSCCLVASGDPASKKLTANADPDLNPELQHSLLEELWRHAHQRQWRVEADSEIILPSLIPVAGTPDHYQLCIEFRRSYGGGNRVVAGDSGEQHPGVLSAREA